jgi:uncharacterized protein (TIGR00255 family)
MIFSMTGFARGEATTPQALIVCELRSVNHRYLEAGLRLPDELRSLEGELRGRLQRELRRGKVDCTVSLRGRTQDGRRLELEPGTLRELTARLGEIASVARSLDVAPQVDLVGLLQFPGVLREAPADSEALLAAARAAFDAALQGLVDMRQREGARLAELLRERCFLLDGLVERVRARLPEVHAQIRARFTERVAELASQLDPERLEQELALMLTRLDVAEELDRLVGHLAETRKILAAPEAAGRRLDFLMQEFNREANTLSSKSQDLETTRAAVDMKVAIEQMREQVQNVE